LGEIRRATLDGQDRFLNGLPPTVSLLAPLEERDIQLDEKGKRGRGIGRTTRINQAATKEAAKMALAD
jgi:hypothetical protein